MLYRYRLLEALDVDDLEASMLPRPVARDDVLALLDAIS